MLSIIDLTISFPGREQRIEEAATPLGLNPIELKMFKRFYGFERFPLDDEQPLFELIDAAMASLTSRHPNLRNQLRILAHCHTIPSIARFGHDVPQFLRGRHVGSATEIMSLTMNHCATGVSILALMNAVLPPDGLGVLLIGEKAFHRTIRLIENTTIMGEAAVAILVGHRVGILEYVGSHTSHDGSFSVISGRPSAEPTGDFGMFYFDFMINHIRMALSKHDLSMDDVRYILPHNVNLPSWHQIAKALEISAAKIYTRNVARHGHCFGADPFINVFDALRRGYLNVGDTVLLVSAGLGPRCLRR